MAKSEKSPIVRLYLASAVGRLPFADRWSILEGLASHAEDIEDHNLPRMYWFGLEPMVPNHPQESLQLAVTGKIPALQEFVARRMATGKAAVNVNRPRVARQTPEWQWTIQKVAPGFKVRNVGEGGVVYHEEMRRWHPVGLMGYMRKHYSYFNIQHNIYNIVNNNYINTVTIWK